MKIPAALESMVADLISDEKQRREEVEGVLSQIHEITAAYFDPEKEKPHLVSEPSSEFVPADPVDPEKLLKRTKEMWMRKGMDEFEAERRAKEMLGVQ